MAQWYVIYCDREQLNWWSMRLKPGYQHCFLVQSIQYGPGLEDRFWMHIDPCLPFVFAGVDFNPQPLWMRDPTVTVQRVEIAQRVKVRDWFAIGPPSCVEIVKAFLGINSFWTRTPWQLYQHIQNRGGVIASR